jgi:hypothetical protein
LKVTENVVQWTNSWQSGLPSFIRVMDSQCIGYQRTTSGQK